MPVMLPSAELLAQWAAEELWDWRVRALFAALCVIAVLCALVAYLRWGRIESGSPANGNRARTYIGRICVSVFVIALAEASFFKEPVSTVLLLATGLAVGLVALSMPRSSHNPDGSEASNDE